MKEEEGRSTGGKNRDMKRPGLPDSKNGERSSCNRLKREGILVEKKRRGGREGEGFQGKWNALGGSPRKCVGGFSESTT